MYEALNNVYDKNYSRVKKVSFSNSLKFTMNNNDRFCFFIIGQGINGSCYGACFVYGYGIGGTSRYHHTDFGNFSVTVGNEDRTFTITTISGSGVQTYIMNFESSDNYTLVAS